MLQKIKNSQQIKHVYIWSFSNKHNAIDKNRLAVFGRIRALRVVNSESSHWEERRVVISLVRFNNRIIMRKDTGLGSKSELGYTLLIREEGVLNDHQEQETGFGANLWRNPPIYTTVVTIDQMSPLWTHALESYTIIENY